MGKSGLSIDAITHGVSSEGVEALLREIRLEMIDRAIENLKKSENFEETVKHGWEGEDRDVFLNNCDKMRNEIIENLQVYYDQIEAEFNTILNHWDEFQASNVSAQ